MAMGAALIPQLSEPGRTTSKEILRRVWWWSQAFPEAQGAWNAGMARVPVPASTQFDAFSVDVFYPTDEHIGDDAWLHRLAWRLLRPTRAQVALDAPVAFSTKPLPLVLYFPSWFSRGQETSFTLANLARHGFVVVALDDVVHLPLQSMSEKIAQSAVLEMNSEFEFARTRSLAGHRMDLEGRVGSIVLDAVSAQRSLHLDRDRVYALGFSFGGGAAAAMSLHDSRIKAVVNLDGSLFGEAADVGVQCPYLAIFGGDLLSTRDDPVQSDLPARLEAVLNEEEVARQARDRHRAGHWTLLMPNAQHLDFSDRLVAPAFADRRSVKTLDRLAMWAALNDNLLRFFADPRNGLKTSDEADATPSKVIRPLDFDEATAQ